MVALFPSWMTFLQVAGKEHAVEVLIMKEPHRSTKVLGYRTGLWNCFLWVWFRTDVTEMPWWSLAHLWEGMGWTSCRLRGLRILWAAWLLWGSSLWTCPKYCHWANFINETVSSFIILFQWLETRTTLTFWVFWASFFYSVMDACAHKFNKY